MCVCGGKREREEGGKEGKGKKIERERERREREKEREGGRKGVHSSAVSWAGSHETRCTNSNRLNQER